MAEYADERKTDYGPRGRKRQHTIMRENWYRDVWLLLITGFMVFTVMVGMSENENRVDDLQRSRYESVLATCLDNNARNLRANEKADRLADADGVSEQGAAVIRTMVAALVPYTSDCEAVARERTEIPGDVLE